VLIHALRESLVPAWDAFAAGWPEAVTYNLLDDSLFADLADLFVDLAPARPDVERLI
jgi:hypothetical protein